MCNDNEKDSRCKERMSTFHLLCLGHLSAVLTLFDCCSSCHTPFEHCALVEMRGQLSKYNRAHSLSEQQCSIHNAESST